MNEQRHPPDWTIQAGRALSQAASRIRVIAAATPSNLTSELARIEQSFPRERGGDACFEYAPAAKGFDELANALLSAADLFEHEKDLGLLYAERARELAVEAMLCVSAGTPAFLHWARKRFQRRDSFDRMADELAGEWLSNTEANEIDLNEVECDKIISDDERDGRSLLSRMRKAVGERCLGFRVVPVQNLAPLASTGDGVIYVAAGRPLSQRDIERTVMHEIEGHALPLAEADRYRLSILRVGTARGSDDQEGRALRLEFVKGFLDIGRRRELAYRHLAARAVEDGAIFSDVVKMLLNFNIELRGALRIAARVCRGGGLAREAVYLPAYLRVTNAIREDLNVDRVLGSGRVSVPSAETLKPWIL